MRNAELQCEVARYETLSLTFRIPNSAFRSPIRQREAQRLQLGRHVDRLHDHVGGHGELDRREVEDRLHARLHQLVHHLLCRLGRRHDDRDVGRLLLEIGRDLLHVPDDQSVPAGPDLLPVLVVDGRDVEAALAETGVLHQRAADPSRAYEHDAVGALEAEDVADLGGELAHRIAQAALAERAEEREILAHLGRRGAAAAREVRRGDSAATLDFGLLEVPEVEREAADGALSDLPHIVKYFTITDSSAIAARTRWARASPDAPPARVPGRVAPPPRPPQAAPSPPSAHCGAACGAG